MDRRTYIAIDHSAGMLVLADGRSVPLEDVCGMEV